MSPNFRRTLVAVLAVAAMAAFAPAAASAKAPPKGTYTCTYYSPSFGTQFAGTLRIHKKSKYSVNGGKKGKFTAKKKKIRFKTGDYKGVWRAKWKRGNGGKSVEINLIDLSDPENDAIVCSGP
jgi:hypothetical protein